MQERGYGDTTIPLEAMRKLLALEVYATRAWSGRHDYLDGRIGFGWATGGSSGYGCGPTDHRRRRPVKTSARLIRNRVREVLALGAPQGYKSEALC